MKPRLILFSGMGGDSRLTRPIEIPELEIVTPEHLEPRANETLPAYAARVADLTGAKPSDILGGTSFGGMLAAEIARQRGAAGVVLLGSCLNTSGLPRSYRIFEKLGKFIPDGILRLRSWRPFVRWRYAPVTPEAEQILVAMAEDCPAGQIRGFGRMVVTWNGVERLDCPVLSIHGDRDRVIPLDCAEPGLVLKEAGHAFTLTHQAQTIAAIREFLKTKIPA